MNTPPPAPDISEGAVSAARLNAIADRTAANYPSLAAELRRIASGIRPAESEVEAQLEDESLAAQ